MDRPGSVGARRTDLKKDLSYEILANDKTSDVADSGQPAGHVDHRLDRQPVFRGVAARLGGARGFFCSALFGAWAALSSPWPCRVGWPR